MTEEVNSAMLLKALGAILKTTAALIAAIATISTFVGWAFQPRIDAYLEARNTPLVNQLAEIRGAVRTIEQSLAGQRPIPFIEFQGNGLVPTDMPVLPGETVHIVYSLRRNRPCPTLVEARFMTERGQIDTSLTYTFNATRAPQTQGFVTFTVSLRVPDGMEPGRYAYAPVLHPDLGDCPSAQEVSVPPSEFFEVADG